METVFKKGMKVYDYIYGKGEVIEVQNYQYVDNILLVKFSNRKEPIKYSLDGRLINYKTCGGDLDSENIATNPTLSISPYTLEGFEQKAPAPTYEEIVRGKNYIYLPENLVAPNKELADATKALLKLLFLRDYYNEGWQPDWSNYNEIKWTIENVNNNLTVTNEYTFNQVMFFNSEKLAFKFLEDQKELLEIAKPLL
jgi:hypothetical protein